MVLPRGGWRLGASWLETGGKSLPLESYLASFLRRGVDGAERSDLCGQPGAVAAGAASPRGGELRTVWRRLRGIK